LFDYNVGNQKTFKNSPIFFLVVSYFNSVI